MSNEVPSQSETSMRREACLLCAIVVAGAILRLWRLGSKSLGVDEAFSVLLSQKPLPEVLTGDLHPPLFHLLLHFIARWGSSEWLVRLPSALAGIIAVPLTYLVMMKFGLPRAGLWAAALVAVSPVHIHHSQEARMYSILVLLCLTSLYCLVRLLKTQSTLHAFWYVVFTSAAVYTHSLAWTVVVSGWVIAVLCEGLPVVLRRTFILSQLAIPAIYLPWVGRLSHHVSSISSGQPLWDWGRALGASFIAFSNFACGYFYYIQDHKLESICFVAMVATGCIVAWVLLSGSHGRTSRIVLTASLLVPFSMSALLTCRTGLSQSKYYIAALVPMLMVIGSGLDRLGTKRSPLLPIYLCLLGGLTSLSLWRYFGPDQLGRDDWRGISHYVAHVYRPGDIAVFEGPWSFYSFDYYTRGQIPILGVPRQAPPSEKSVNEELREMQRKWDRVVLIVSPGSQVGVDPHNLVSKCLIRNGTKVEEREFGAITVSLVQLSRRMDL